MKQIENVKTAATYSGAANVIGTVPFVVFAFLI